MLPIRQKGPRSILPESADPRRSTRGGARKQLFDHVPNFDLRFARAYRSFAGTRWLQLLLGFQRQRQRWFAVLHGLGTNFSAVSLLRMRWTHFLVIPKVIWSTFSRLGIPKLPKAFQRQKYCYFARAQASTFSASCLGSKRNVKDGFRVGRGPAFCMVCARILLPFPCFACFQFHIFPCLTQMVKATGWSTETAPSSHPLSPPCTPWRHGPLFVGCLTTRYSKYMPWSKGPQK